jgi:integrase
MLVLPGPRRSEVLGLQWSDTDLAAGTLTVARGVTADAKGGRADTAQDHARGARVLPLPPWTCSPRCVRSA